MPCCDGISNASKTVCNTVYAAGNIVKENILMPPYRVVHQIYVFVRDHFAKIVKFFLSWAVILSFTGLLYGFHATSLPLSIGLGCGAAVGVVLGICSKAIFHKTRCALDANPGKNTIYGQISWWLWEQDEGTKALLNCVAVTVIFAAIAIFPLETGVFLGVLVGNHVVVAIILYDEHAKKDIPVTIPGQIENLETRLKAIEKHFPNEPRGRHIRDDSYVQYYHAVH